MLKINWNSSWGQCLDISIYYSTEALLRQTEPRSLGEMSKEPVFRYRKRIEELRENKEVVAQLRQTVV